MPTLNTGDTAFVLLSAALVLLMTPGLAFFYGGLVRRKNVLDHHDAELHLDGHRHHHLGVVGYSLAYSGDTLGPHRRPATAVGLQGVGLTPSPIVRHHRPLPRPLPLPADVRHHHACAHHRRVRRPRQLQGVPDVSRPLEPAGLHPLRALDLGRRVPRQAGARRLRRRHRGAPERRHGRAGLGLRGRQAHAAARREASRRTTSPSWPWAPGCCGSAGSASTAAARSRPTGWRRWPSSTPTSRRRWACRVAVHLVVARGQAQHDGRDDRRGGGSGDRHSRGGLRRRPGPRWSSACSPAGLLWGGPVPHRAQLGRRARRLGRARRRWRAGHDPDGGLRAGRHQQSAG